MDDRLDVGAVPTRQQLRVGQAVSTPKCGKWNDLATKAYRSYGRGQHPAALNFGDCFAYALAKEALLAKGEDYRKTDLVLASY